MTEMGERWMYEIRIGYAEHPETGEQFCVYLIADDQGETLKEGIANDVQDATVQIAEALLNVHDDKDAAEAQDGE